MQSKNKTTKNKTEALKLESVSVTETQFRPNSFIIRISDCKSQFHTTVTLIECEYLQLAYPCCLQEIKACLLVFMWHWHFYTKILFWKGDHIGRHCSMRSIVNLEDGLDDWLSQRTAKNLVVRPWISLGPVFFFFLRRLLFADVH